MIKIYKIFPYLLFIAVGIIFVIANNRFPKMEARQEILVYQPSEFQKQKIFLYENLGNGKSFWELYDVINCESGWNQELKHINYHKEGDKCFPTSTDWGTGMINDCYWDEDAKAMGLDYKNNVYDNLFMISYIYKVYGITQWVCYNNGYK
jgi:hypothetical protein